MKESKFLNFINNSSKNEISKLGKGTKDNVGADLAQEIVAYRDKLEGKQFSSIKELSKVKGWGEVQLTSLLKAMDTASKVEFTTSNTYINFIGEPQVIEHLAGQYSLKKVQSFKEENGKGYPLNRYELHYDRTRINKETLLQSFQTQGGFVKSQLGALIPYALQANDNNFLSVNSAGAVTFSDKLTDDEIFVFNFGTHVPGWPYAGRLASTNAHIYQPNGSGSFTINKLNGNGLYYDYSNNKLSYDVNGSVFNSNPPNLPFGFEAFFLPNSFNMMNYYSHNIPVGNDPRKFIAQEGMEAKGSNTTEWFAKNFYRPIRVIRNISLKSQHFSNGTHYHLISTDSNGNVSSNAVAINSNIPNESKFDMFIFYGWQWYLWKDTPYTPRVVFRSKANGRYLTVDNNGYLNCASLTISHNENFALERMWGNNNSFTAIKTHLGKYIHTYNGTVSPNGINKVVFEAYEILEP